jgi:hypothetical protein
MILNGYTLLDLFVTLLRLGLALVVIGLAFAAWRGRRRADTPEARGILEDRLYLLFALALLLLVVNLASWPLLYLLLESYIPEWPGVMCIYGVMQVGAGSLGPARFLPGLALALQVLKPALVFLSGAWMMLYLANRRTTNAPLMTRLLLVLLGLGVLAGIDAGVEAAYLVIPKKEVFLATGCCTATLDTDPGRFLPAVLVGATSRPWLAAGCYLINGALILALFASIHTRSAPLPRPGLALLLIGAVVALPVSAVFLKEVAAPILLRLPHHHCPYDLIPQAPESILAVASFACGTFAVGWACVAGWFARCPETLPFLGELVRKVLVVGLFGYLGAVVMLTIELAL